METVIGETPSSSARRLSVIRRDSDIRCIVVSVTIKIVAILALLCLAQFVAVLDGTVVLVALPAGIAGLAGLLLAAALVRPAILHPLNLLWLKFGLLLHKVVNPIVMALNLAA